MQTQQEQEQVVSSLPFISPTKTLEQPPAEEGITFSKASRKQILSKRTYIRRAAHKSLSFGLASGGGVLGLIAIFYGIYRLAIGVHTMPFLLKFPVLLLVTLLSGIGIYEVLKRSTIAYKKDIGVPLTRANTADLPAPESLVRASAEPVQEQQAVLLRAATETAERHEEQLVRASVGGME